MSDELTRAIAEALAEALPGYSIRGRGATSAEIAAALAPLIEARVREARADELEKFAGALDGQFPERSGSLMGRLVNPSIRQVAEAARIWAEDARNG